MNKYLKEITILTIQLLMFYIFPLFTKPDNTIAMVLSIMFITFILSIIIGSTSKVKVKYFYPLIISILFIPSVFIYYNESALIHTTWYFVNATIGLAIGVIINKISNKVKRGIR